MKKKIIVTGAAGFLGGRTAKFLASHFKGYQLLATSRRSTRKLELEAHDCDFIGGNLCDQDFCEAITENTEMVVHCAALSAPYGLYNDFYNSNVIATQNLLNASVKNGVKKFIFISTPSIYFDYTDRFDVKESEPLPKKLVNHYATTKLIAENMVLNNNSDIIQTIALRPRAIIGAEDTVIFPRVLKAYHQGKLKIIGSGDIIADFTCVRNVIEAIICAIDAPITAYGKAYNITDGTSVDFWKAIGFSLSELGLTPPSLKIPKSLALTIASLIEFKAKLLQQSNEPTLTKYGIGILSTNFTMDITRAREELNYKPKMNTYEGIKEYTSWYKEQI
jgi:nucleoside-diphosphate-sugar epimerase